MLRERPAPFRDSSLFVLGVEGEEAGAECQYFAELERIDLLDLRRVRLLPLPTGAADHESSPRAVLGRVRAHLAQCPPKPFDRVWLVLDVDRWTHKMLAAVARDCRTAGYALAVSNACFEIWLLMHVDCDLTDLTRLPLGKRSQPAKTLWSRHRVPLTVAAIARAYRRASDLASAESPGARWPSFPGSHIFKLLDDLLARDLITRHARALVTASS
jgi:hypothetical protein